ncbi:MAG: hypothetical protein AAF533_02565 [Acidobacteriota bacterium]
MSSPTNDPELPRAELSVTFEVAGVRVRLDRFPVAASFLEEHYPGFHVVDGADDVQLVVSCSLRLGEAVIPLPKDGSPALVPVDVDGGRLLTRSHFHEAMLDLAAGHGEACFTTLGPHHFRMSLENLLRVTFANLLLERRACLVHAAALVDGDIAHVLFGLSGSGKSRLVELVPERPTLSDDLVVLQVDEAEAAWSERVPFYGEHPPTERRGGRYRVATLSALERGDTHRREPLPRPLQVARLRACLPFLDPTDPRPLDLVRQLTESLDPKRLVFADDAGFWDLLNE